MLSNFLDNGGCLQGKFSCGDEDNDLDVCLGCVRLLQTGDDICGCFACPIFGSGQDCLVLIFVLGHV